MIGVSQPTISREIVRNSGQRGYRHKQAREIRSTTRSIQDTYQDVSQPCGIYQHVWFDKHAGDELYKLLRQQGKKYDKRRNGKSTRL